MNFEAKETEVEDAWWAFKEVLSIEDDESCVVGERSATDR